MGECRDGMIAFLDAELKLDELGGPSASFIADEIILRLDCPEVTMAIAADIGVDLGEPCDLDANARRRAAETAIAAIIATVCVPAPPVARGDEVKP